MLGPQNVVRRKLADISNLPQNQWLSIQDKSQCIETTAREYIEQLQKENMALVKMLAQRNKIIEQSGIELDRLRVTLLKMQEQNQQLALSNTQMLVELNTGKDRLKLLQHELGCKSGLLKARKLKLELKKCQEEGESFKEVTYDEKPHKTKRNLKSTGLGPEQDQSKDNIQNKRPFSRRQSARFKAAEVKPTDDLFETNNKSEVSLSQSPDDKKQTENNRRYVRRQSAKFKGAEVKPAENIFEANGNASQLPNDEEQTEIKRESARFRAAEVKTAEELTEKNGTKISDSKLPDDAVQEQGSTSESALVKNEGHMVSSVPKYVPEEFTRLSMVRPSRVAVKKVKSYKEIPLNVKMRRS